MKLLKYYERIVYFKTGTILFVLCIISLISISSIRISAQSSINQSIELVERIYPRAYVINGEWIYYISLYDNRLYRMSREGNTKELISDDNCSEYGLMVLYNSIYYINKDDGNSLYRINTNGKEKLKISQKGLNDFYGNFFSIGNSLYYYENDVSMYKFDAISWKIEKLNSYEANFINKFTPQSRIYNGTLYYTNPEGIFGMNLESKSILKISRANVYGEIMIEDNWIYYINKGDLKLCRVGINSREIEVISEGPVMTIGADYDSGGFYIDGGNVYFTCISEDGNRELRKFDTASKMSTLIKIGVDHFYIEGDYIYYIDSMENGSLYRVGKDGMNSRIITSGEFIPYINAAGDIVFYMIKSEDVDQPAYGRLIKIRVDGQDKSEIM